MQESSKFETLKLVIQYWNSESTSAYIILFLFFALLILFFFIGILFQKKLRQNNLKRYFINFAKEKNLTKREIEILWNYSQKMDRDPILVLEFKAPFEKIIDLYIKNDPDADENIVKDLRKKLGFEVQSPYVPLVTTKDIEIFQNGRMIFSNNYAINVALYDKDEWYMYWLAIDNDVPANIQPGEHVKVVFVRNEDGIYSFELPIADIIEDGKQTIIKIPHTFELSRMQRREYPRVKTDIAVTIKFHENTVEGKIVDLSAGGARICSDDKTLVSKLAPGDTINLNFALDEKNYTILSTILEIEKKAKSVCLRVLFAQLPQKIKNEILEYVQKEQLQQAQIHKQR